jgi:geranylgeranyl diphosphate synthase type II
VTAAALPLDAYLRAHRDRVDAALAVCLPSPPACPAIISTAMRYSLFAGGKRFRPVLALAAAEAIAGAPWLKEPPDCATGEDDAVRLALPAACAIELIHTYSLVHDDLPAMDDDTLRRGRPTLHVVHGEGMAILAGDGLLTDAFALLAREPASDRPAVLSRRMRTVAEIATAAGSTGMVGGQAIDLQAAEDVAQHGAAAVFDFDALRHMHACKTGAMIRVSAVAGAIMAGGSEHAIGAVSRYAVSLGLAFQIVDDILDVEGATEDLGKTPGKDAAAGKPTYPALVGLERSRQLAREAYDAAIESLASVGLGAGRLQEIAHWAIRRSN